MADVEESMAQNKRLAARLERARTDSSRSSISDRIRKRKGRIIEEENVEFDINDEVHKEKDPDSVSSFTQQHDDWFLKQFLALKKIHF